MCTVRGTVTVTAGGADCFDVVISLHKGHYCVWCYSEKSHPLSQNQTVLILGTTLDWFTAVTPKRSFICDTLDLLFSLDFKSVVILIEYIFFSARTEPCPTLVCR